MMRNWVLALAAATALMPVAAMAQDGRGREGRRGDGADRAARFERARDSGVQLGGEARGGFNRPMRPAFRDRPEPPAAQPRPAPDAGVRPPRDGGPRFRGEGRPDRPAFRPGGDAERRGFGGPRLRGEGRLEQPAFRPGGNAGRPAFRRDRPATDGERGRRFGGFRDRRDNEGLLNQGPAGRERFTRQRQEANRRFEQRQDVDRADIRTGRQDWRRDEGRRGDWRQRDRRWYGDNNWGGDWNRGDRGGWDRGNWNRGGWDRGWRSDRRYDWRGYRAANRGFYRLPRYYAPQGYYGGYRRFGIGFTLSSLLFAPDYWIDDPWSYRLPDADGPYRWVRYYNDALLVDVESGEVVDVEHDIFW